MTKKNKTILGVVGGLLVIGGIRAASGVGNDQNNHSAYISSPIAESGAAGVQSADSSSVFGSSVNISSPTAESGVAGVQSDDGSSFFGSSVYISSSIAESGVVGVQSTYSSSAFSSSTASQPMISDLDNSNSSADEPVSSVSSVEPPQSSIPSAPESSNNSTTHLNDYDIPAQQQTTTYVLNTNTKKFHYPNCSSVKQIKPKNYSTISSRSDAISGGYSPCKRCNP